MAKRRDERPKKPPLFNRPMNELREAFVRARFAEEACFGRPDIEEWLAREREAERPEYERSAALSTWSAVLASDHMLAAFGDPLAVLVAHATPLTVPPLGVECPFVREASRDAIASLCRALGKTARVYYSHADNLVILTDNQANEAPSVYLLAEGRTGEGGVFLLLHDNGRTLAASMAVMSIVFAEWLYGRPKWREARQFLCAALSLDIRVQRDSAESDFDDAVAVSDGGTKIVRADWVVTTNRATKEIWSDRNTDRRFTPEEVIWIPKARFSKKSGRKIRLAREEDRRRKNSPWVRGVLRDAHSHDMARYVFECVYGSPTNGRQLLLETPDGEKILVTDPVFVPPELLSAPSGR